MTKYAIGLLCLLLVLLALVPATSNAQGVTTSAINGKITGANGEGLPGVNVIAVHDPSGSVYGASTREDGRYTLPNLRVGGPYTVTASLIGYQKRTARNLWLQLSQTLDLDLSLQEEAVQASEVVVEGVRSSVFNAARTGAATNVSRVQIDGLPTLTRNFQDYYRVSPYASGDRGNVAGRNSRYNNIQIDGITFNDLFGLGATGAPAGQSSVTPISLDAIEEFQLVISPYDVRQSGFTGAGVNAITRSGTNQYRASAFYYGRNEGFSGLAPTTNSVLKTKLAGFSDYQLGGRVGGPIIQDKLFFFANGEMTRYSQPLTRAFDQPRISTNAYTASSDSLTMLTNYLKSKYGYDVGSFSSFNINKESDKLFLRLDYNLSEMHKVTARWSYLRSSEDNSPSRGRSLTDIYAENGRYKLDNNTNTVALQLTSVFSNTMSNELIFGYVNQFDHPVYYGAAFPALYIATSNRDAADRSTQNLVLGGEQFRHYNELGQKSFEITDNFSYYLPGHTITVGARADIFSFRNLFIPSGFGTYTYTSIAAFLADAQPSAYEFRYSATNDPLQEANWNARQFGFYAQDEWTVMPALKVTGGIRFDLPTYPSHPNHNPGIFATFGYRTDKPPKTTVAVSPRIGFNWALDEQRDAQLRGGVGVFYGRFPFVWVSNQYSNTGVDFYTVTSRPTRFNPDPYGQAKLPPTSTTAEVNLTDPNFKAPSITRTSLAFDYKLPFDVTATVEGILSWTQNDVYYENINLAGPQENSGLTAGGKLPGEGREVWGTYNSTNRRFSPVWKNQAFSPGVFLVKNTDLGSNSNIAIQLTRSVSEGINGILGYTWGMAKDINSMNSTTASSGWRFNPTPGNPNKPQLTYSQWDRRHRFIAAVSYRHDWGGGGFATSVGLFYSGMSGRPFSYMVDGDVNGDGRSDNDLAYIPRDANDIILVNSSGTALATSAPEYAALLGYVAKDNYLNENRGKISERSGPREPWSHSIDMRISQEIPTVGGQKFELTLDILNVLNLINSRWGWVRNVGVNQTVNLMRFHSLDATSGRPRYQWTGLSNPYVPDNLLSRYQMQIGVRYTL